MPTQKRPRIECSSAQLVHAAEIVSWWKRYESYVATAVKHFEANPADLADDTFKFTPKQMGLSERSYDYIAESLARYGVPSLEQLAREAVSRRKTNPTAPLLLKDHYRAMAAQSQNEITLESNLSTRPPSVHDQPAPGAGESPARLGHREKL